MQLCLLQFPVPHNRYNSEFFASKPTRRHVTSQNPYAEQFIGEPYVYTIDITNVIQVTRAMKNIMKKPVCSSFLSTTNTQESEQ